MRRVFILITMAAAMATTQGCSWYDAFCRRFGGSSMSAEELDAKRRQDVSQMAEPD
jgi:hypothetical protein